jgi:hypothetical protein
LPYSSSFQSDFTAVPLHGLSNIKKKANNGSGFAKVPLTFDFSLAYSSIVITPQARQFFYLYPFFDLLSYFSPVGPPEIAQALISSVDKVSNECLSTARPTAGNVGENILDLSCAFNIPPRPSILKYLISSSSSSKEIPPIIQKVYNPVLLSVLHGINQIITRRGTVLTSGWPAIFLIFAAFAHTMEPTVVGVSFGLFKEIFNDKMVLWMPFALMEAIIACVAYSYSMKFSYQSIFLIPSVLNHCVDACTLIGVVAQIMSGSSDMPSRPLSSNPNSVGQILWEGSDLSKFGLGDLKTLEGVYIPTNLQNSNNKNLSTESVYTLIQKRALFLSSQVQLNVHKSNSFFRYLWAPLIVSMVVIIQGQLEASNSPEAMYDFFF